jgi:hypothetical protein
VIQTRFTAMFGLEHPLMSAPMALHCGGTLAAAVSTAGGLGSFGGIHAEGAAWVSGRPWPKGIAVRTQRDAFTDEWAGREAELRARVRDITPPSRPRLFGPAARFVDNVRPAAEVLHEMTDDAERVLHDQLATFDTPSR